MLVIVYLFLPHGSYFTLNRKVGVAYESPESICTWITPIKYTQLPVYRKNPTNVILDKDDAPFTILTCHSKSLMKSLEAHANYSITNLPPNGGHLVRMPKGMYS